MHASDTQHNDYKNENRTSCSDFTEGSILQKLVPFMLPILGALVLQAAYGAVDLLVVGRFGSTTGLSAVSTGSQVLNLVTFVVTQFAMGVTVLIARYLGEGKADRIGRIIGGAAVVFGLMSVVLFILMVGWARSISVLMQAPTEAIDLPLAMQECLTQFSFLALCAFVNRLGLDASSGYGVACKLVNFAMLIPSALMQSMSSFVSQNIGAGKTERAKKSMFTGIGIGLSIGCIVFLLVWFEGGRLSGVFTTDPSVITHAFAYLRGFAPETLLTAILFSMMGYFNGSGKTLFVMFQGLFQTLLIRLPMSYYMSIQPNASLTKIGLAAPTSTLVGVLLNVAFFLYLQRKTRRETTAGN